MGVRLATNRSQVRVPADPLHVTIAGKLFTHVCLCLPSSINWYRHKLGAEQNRHSTQHTGPVSVVLQLLLLLYGAPGRFVIVLYFAVASG